MLKHAATGLLVVPIVAIGFMALTSDFQVDSIKEELTARLLEILPQRDCHNAEPTAAPAHSSENTSAYDNHVSEAGVAQGRRSSFDPAGPYNSRKSMEQRALGLRDVCIKYKDFMRPENVLSAVQADFDDILVNAPTMTTFCTLPKVAQKPMATLFTRLRQPSPEEDNRLKYFKANFPVSMKEMKKSILVRHPLERLVSTYRHKYEKVYNPVSKQEEGGELEWLDFIYIVLHGPVEYAEFLEEHEMEAGSVAIDTGMIDGKGASKAWAPFWMKCGVCNPLFMPDFIMHLDHFKEDAKTMLDILEVPEDRYSGWLNSKTETKSNIREVEEHYYGQLTKSEIRQLAEKFRHDLELFGFSADYYVALGQDDE